jgi:hypothetical protein
MTPAVHGRRKATTHARPRSNDFKEAIIQAFYAGIKHMPETTFGSVQVVPIGSRPWISGANSLRRQR